MNFPVSRDPYVVSIGAPYAGGNLAVPNNDAAAADRVPEGLAASDWSGIRAAYEAGRHAAFACDGGYQARNPGQQWRTRFDGRGFLTTPDAGGWSWGLQLVSYGRPGAQQALAAHERTQLWLGCDAAIFND